MSARTVQDQVATVREVSITETIDRNPEMSDKPVRGHRIYPTDNRRDYVLGATPAKSSQPADTPSLSVVQGDDERLMRVLRQLEVIAELRPARIAFKVKGNILFLNLADIASIEAQGNYVSFRHRTHPHLVHESLSSMADKLKPYGFIRIHRSVVVNTAAVEEIKPRPTGEYRLRVKGGKEYVVTRTYTRNLIGLAQLWVGTCSPQKHSS